MRVVLLILLLAIWQASADAPASPVASGAMWFAIGYGLLIAVARLWGGRVAIAGDTDEDYGTLSRRINRFNVGMAVARWGVPAWFAVGTFVLGWHHTVDGLVRQALGPYAALVATPGVAVGLLPGIAAWAGLWWSQYPVDRAAGERRALVHLEAGMPVFSPPPLGRYLANRVRVQLLFTTVPVLLILASRDGAMLALRAMARAGRLRWPVSDGIESAVEVVTTAAVMLAIPVVLRRVLSTRSLPDGRLRRGLNEVLRLAGVRCRDVLLWDTHHTLGNAAVMGLLAPVRYVLFTDLLVESMTDEHLQAVFAHELGHVRHRHLAWFVVVLGTFMAGLTALGDWTAGHLHPRTEVGREAATAALLATAAAVVWVAFGTLSRWLERQADVYAARLMDRALPGTGAVAMAGALRRVAVVNNILPTARNWTHGSIATRVAFIHRMASDPAVAERFDRKVWRMRVGLLTLVVVSAAVASVGFWRG